MSTDTGVEARRRTRHRRLIIAGLTGLVISFIGIEIALQRSIDTGVPAVLLHSITALNIILLLTLLFVLGRNLIKLYVDRRHRKLGSKFQTKLMATYVGLSLVPTIILFLVASDFIQKSIDRWFSSDVTAIHERARELQRKAIAAEEGELLSIGTMLAQWLFDDRLVANESWQVLERDMGRRLEAETHLDLDAAIFYPRAGETIGPIVREGSLLQGREHHVALEDEQLRLGMAGQAFPLQRQIEASGLLLLSATPVRAVGSDEVEGVVVIARMADPALAAEVAAIDQLYGNYAEGVQGKGPITNVYLLTFLLISLLIIFGAVWLGLYLARGVTVPIQKLSEGTRAVAAGNLDYRVDAETNDELGVLVESFNRMTSDLAVGQRSLEQSRIDLEQSITELEERRSYMESVLANIATGVVSVNAEGRITTINPAASDMLGIADEVVGQPYDEVFAGENMAPLRTLMQHARPRLAALEEELTLEAAGRRLTLAAHCSSLRDSSGDYLGTVTVLDDLTGLIGAQKAAAWREVARRVAHEIRNPLTPIQLSAQRIARRYQRAAGAETEYAVIEEGTRTILQEVATLKSLVEEFSRFARMPSAQPVVTDLHRLIDDSLRPYPDMHPGVEITRHFATDLPQLELDPDQMRRAFTNLFDNAVKAMEGSGRLAVSTLYDDDLEVVRIAVTDSGPGIRPEDKEQLFVPYFSRDRDGTGLGLAIVRQIVSDHRGYIRVVDNVPHGATFVIELPTG